MCGRYTQRQSSEAIAKAFQVANVPPLTPRYNIAPTQAVAAVLQTAEHPERYLEMLHWGLIPSWAKDATMGARLINARSETVTERPAFRGAFRYRRCLIVADGFYEWQQQGRQKQPFYCHLKDEQPFAFAGLWEIWEKNGNAIASCTILTTQPNEVMQPIHDRMPVILHPKDWELWLDPKVQKPELLQPLLRPYPAEEAIAYPVSTLVNKPANDAPECIQKI